MRIVKVTVDGCIQLTPLEMEELKLVPGQEYIIERDNDIITLTPLTLLPARQ